MGKYMGTAFQQYGEFYCVLKEKCLKFTDEHFEKDIKKFIYEQLDKTKGQFLDLNEARFTQYSDIFLLFGENNSGKRILDIIIEKGQLTGEEKKVIEEWKKRAFNAVFEILEINDHDLRLFDIVGEVEYKVFSNQYATFTEMMPDVKKGFFMDTNIVPIGEEWFLSGAQQTWGPEYAEKLYLGYVQERQSSEKTYRNNPGKLAVSFDLNKKEYSRFKDFFDSDEIFLKGKAVGPMLQEYYENCIQEAGDDSSVPKFTLPTQISESENMAIVMDEREGLHFFTNFEEFSDVFKSGELNQGAKELILGYLEDETIPAFVFRRMVEKFPENYKKIMKRLQDRKADFDFATDFEALMNHFKPGWKNIFPSIHPMNEKLKKYLYKQHKTGRNDPCTCGSGKKYKKCCFI